MRVLLTFLAVVALVVLHELGHFIAGRICHVPIYEFCIGFGPELFHIQGKSTKYTFRAIPLGGYCAFDQDDPTGAVDDSLHALPLAKRIFIYAMGPVTNILTCIILLFFVFFAVGMNINTATVEIVQEGIVGVQPGDRLISIEGVEINSAAEMDEAFEKVGSETVNMTFERDGKPYDVSVDLTKRKDGSYSTGILFKQQIYRLPLTTSIKQSFVTSGEFMTSLYRELGKMFVGKANVSEMTSIVGAIDVISEYATLRNIASFIYLIAFISANLGIINLLPIPGLDGSKILFGIIETITRKRIPANVEFKVTVISFAIIFGFAGYLMLRDASDIILRVLT